MKMSSRWLLVTVVMSVLSTWVGVGKLSAQICDSGIIGGFTAGPNATGTNCPNDGFQCTPPELLGVAYFAVGAGCHNDLRPSLCTPCDPAAGACQIRAQLSVRVKGIRNNWTAQPFLEWHTAEWRLGPTLVDTCGESGGGFITDDYFDSWVIGGGFSCANPGGLTNSGTYDVTHIVCPSQFSCPKIATFSVPLTGAAASAALCPEPPPTDPGDSCPLNPSGRGASAAGGEATTTSPPESGPPGVPFRNRPRGPGEPSFPGSLGALGVDPWSTQLGRYWLHPYAQRIVPTPDETLVYLITENGTFHRFTNLSGGIYQDVVPSDDYRGLEYLGAGLGWTLTELDGTVRKYRADGLWHSTTDRNGNATTGCYVETMIGEGTPTCDPDGAAPLQAIEFPDARRVDVGYDGGGRLQTLSEVGIDGTTTRTWTYQWDADDLEKITRPDLIELHFFYNDSRYPGYMTRQDLVPAGGGTPRVLAGWQYDADGNVIATWRGDTDAGPNGDVPGQDAVDLYTFSIDDPQPGTTRVTNPEGGETLVSFERVDGKPIPTSINGDCPMCGFGSSTRFEYLDGANPLLPTEVEDGEGNITTFAYDANGRMTSRTEAVNAPALTGTTSWQYHPVYKSFVTLLERESVESGFRTTTNVYDASNGDLTTQTLKGFEANNPDFSTTGLVTTYGYNAEGRVTSVNPPHAGDTDDTTTWTFDPARGNLLPATRTDPLNLGTTTFTYDAFNRRIRTLDANGLAVDTQYDGNSDRVEWTIQRADSGTAPGDPPASGDLATQRLYNAFGDLETTILPKDNRIVYDYDDAGRLTSIERQDDLGAPQELTSYMLDDLGNRTEELLQRWDGKKWVPTSETDFTFTEGGCLLESVTRDPSGVAATTTYGYDCNGNLTAVWDANRTTAADPSQTLIYDELERLKEVRQPWAPAGMPCTDTDTSGCAITEYDYDVQDHLAEVIDAEGNVTQYTYSDRDLLTQQVSVASGTTDYTYNPHGELLTETDARGVVVTRTVDAADRVTIVDYDGDSDLETTFTYGTNPALFEQGRLVGITRAGSTIDYEYDSFGRVVRDGALTYDYDLNGNRDEIGYPGGRVATYEYDSADRQKKLSFDPGTGVETIADNATYLPSGPLERVELGSGFTEIRGFDGRYAPSSIVVQPTAGGAAVFSWSYTALTPPDAVGNIRSIADVLNAANNRTYAYQDVHYFLTAGDGPWGTLDWTYDRIGNRLSESRNGATADTYSYHSNGSGNTPVLDQITFGAGTGTKTYSFDAAGSLDGIVNTAAPSTSRTFGVDNARRMGTIEDSPDVLGTLAYDGRGFLTALELPSLTVPGYGDFSYPTYSSEGTLFHQQELEIAFATIVRDHYVLYLAGRPIYTFNKKQGPGAPKRLYVTTDHLGTPAMAWQPGRKEVYWQGGFEPFGADYANAPQKEIFLRLPGQWHDQEWDDGQGDVGLEFFYNVHRWYETGTGRYTSTDAFPFSLLSHDYAYVENRPTYGKDPNGRFLVGPVEVGCAIAGGIGGAIEHLPHGTRFAHCMTSCEISRQCGPITAAGAGVAKEFLDLFLCGAFGLEKNCDSAFQTQDFFDDAGGLLCPLSCEESCGPLRGAPEPPAGPFGSDGGGW